MGSLPTVSRSVCSILGTVLAHNSCVSVQSNAYIEVFTGCYVFAIYLKLSWFGFGWICTLGKGLYIFIVITCKEFVFKKTTKYVLQSYTLLWKYFWGDLPRTLYNMSGIMAVFKWKHCIKSQVEEEFPALLSSPEALV